MNAAVVAQSGSNAAEIESKRTIGLVKIVVGIIAAGTGVSTMVTAGQIGGTTALVVGAGLGGGGAWLIYDGVQDRAEAAEMEASSSLDFAPTRGGAAVAFSRSW